MAKHSIYYVKYNSIGYSILDEYLIYLLCDRKTNYQMQTFIQDNFEINSFFIYDIYKVFSKSNGYFGLHYQKRNLFGLFYFVNHILVIVYCIITIQSYELLVNKVT